jgi:Phage protein Gp138 N-terminal domain
VDPRERLGDDQEALRMALDQRQADIHTGFPGIVQSYNADAMTAQIQPAIQASVRNQLGEYSWVSLPVLLDCPVHFPSGGGFTLTFPLAPGDEVFVCIAERCIDAWWSSGGVQPQAELRMHDLSDGFCFPKVWSQPKKLSPAPSTTAAQLRSDDGATVIEVANADIKITPDNGTTYLEITPGLIHLVATTIKEN